MKKVTNKLRLYCGEAVKNTNQEIADDEEVDDEDIGIDEDDENE